MKSPRSMTVPAGRDPPKTDRRLPNLRHFIAKDRIRDDWGPNLLSRDYRGLPHRRLHSPRAERTREKSELTPIARSVQTKK